MSAQGTYTYQAKHGTNDYGRLKHLVEKMSISDGSSRNETGNMSSPSLPSRDAPRHLDQFLIPFRRKGGIFRETRHQMAASYSRS